MSKKKKRNSYSLQEILSPDYPGTKAERQTDLCEAWNEEYILKDMEIQDRHGIVYTPVEVVDFMIESINYLAQKEFGVSLSEVSKITDPFAGTGIFGARLADLGYSVDNLECDEIDPVTAEVAKKNISVSAGKEFDNVKVQDTFGEYEKELGGNSYDTRLPDLEQIKVGE